MLGCGEKIRISIGLADECVIPSGLLRGEVIVVVSPSCKDGVHYRRIRLELTGEEHNAVRDDQGEFDELLDGYTSDRTYLSRHVTLSGRKKASEDAETALQRKQEVMFRQHHTAPYSRVIPVRPKESSDGKKKAESAPAAPVTSAAGEQSKPTAETPSPQQQQQQEQQPVNASPATRADRGDVEVEKRKKCDANEPVANANAEDNNPHPSSRNSSRSSSNHSSHSSRSDDSEGGNGITLPETVMKATPDKNVSSGTTPSTGDAVKASSSTQHEEAPGAAPTAAGLQRLQAEEERAVDEAKAERHSGSKDLRLMPGRYTFPFSFRVPPWLPPSLYYSIEDSSGYISYAAKATVDFGPGRRRLASHKRFYVLSAISRRQLIACHEEAINAATTNPLPPLSALFQVFSCSCLGNMCCLSSHSAIEVEVALQCSRALVLADANATYKVFREYQAAREDLTEDAGRKLDPGASVMGAVMQPGTATAMGGLAGAFNGYDAFMERKYLAPEEDFTSPAAFADKLLKSQQQAKDEGLSSTASDTNPADPASSQDAKGNAGGSGTHTDPHSRAARLAAYRQSKKEAMRERRIEVEKALPLPIGVLPLLVRVHNGCSQREVPKVRVELRETIQVFKSLEMPREFHHPLARYEYTVPIPPGDEVTFAARLQLPKQFRRRQGDDPKLCPPPGVKTANITTSTSIVVTFPGLSTYVEEEDWVNSVVQLAEAVDMSDEVLDLPVRYS